MILRNLLTLFIFINLIISCNSSKKDNYSVENKKNSKTSIVFIDSIDSDMAICNIDHKSIAIFTPIYFGPYSDTINSNYSTINKNYHLPDKNNIKTRINNLNLSITVDTSQLIPFAERISNIQEFVDSLGRFVPYLTPLEFLAYPVIIKNKSNDSLRIYNTENIDLHLEAIDTNGEWKTIQKNFYGYCTTVTGDYYLLPNEILITTCKVFEGSYSTKLRLTYPVYNDSIYSNEFSGFINYYQFE